MPIMEVHEKLSLSRVENVVALKGYSGQSGCATLFPTGRGLSAEDQVNDLEDQGTILYANHRHLFLGAYVYTVLLDLQALYMSAVFIAPLTLSPQQ